MESTSIYNAYNIILYLVNKVVYQLFGENSRALSRLAAKYAVDYLHSKNIVDKNNLDEESVKRAFIEYLGFCDDLIYSEEDGQAILKIVNPALREGIVELGKENLPVIIAPGIIYGYLINDIRNHKASYQEQGYDEETNTTIVKFKIIV